MVPVLTAASIVLLAAILYFIWKRRWGYPPPGIPAVLTYHKVTRFELGGTWITPSMFSRHLDGLLDAGFSFIDEDTFIDTLDGRREGRRSEILLTFDDGYRMILDSAVPVMEERGIPALIFLVTSFMGRENTWELQLPGRRFAHMAWDEVKDLVSRGFGFGSHTRSHRDLTRLGTKEREDELTISREVIENFTGRRVRSLSYPFGRTDSRISSLARSAGYEAAFTLYPSGPQAIADRYALRREGVWIIDTAGCVRAKVSGGGLFWVEDLKGRAINGVAALTPVLKREDPFRV